MTDFIKSLAVSFGATGLSPRAITLFTQAKSASNFRWGQKSRGVAAACLAIALREANRPDSIRDIASILKVSASSVSREFMSVTSTLKLALTLVDPSVHISTLQNHLAFALQQHRQICGLPRSLVTSLQKLCLRSTARTAVSLSQLLARFSPHHDVLRLPVAPTACGIFMLALEAEDRGILNPLGDLAQFLGSPCYAAKSVVMDRYKIVQDEVARWIDKVPWLDKYESRNGRAKVSKRLVVARGLKDVIQFQEDIWQRRIQPLLNVDLGSDEDLSEARQPIQHGSPSPYKRPKLNHALIQTAHFLLDPLGKTVSSTMLAFKEGQTKVASKSLPGLPLATYMLTNASTSMIRRPPTRLQLLAQDRGGVSEEQIPDDELFTPGELEGFLRNNDEIQVFRSVFGWNDGEDSSEKSQTISHSSRRINQRKRLRDEAESEEQPTRNSDLLRKKKSRINMEAFAQFLAEGHNDSDGNSQDSMDAGLLGLDEVVQDCGFDDHDDHDNSQNDHSCKSVSMLVQGVTSTQQWNTKHTSKALGCNDGDDEELVLEDWRPPSPEPIIGGLYSQYEEEYD
ncbi:hypothetical protein HYPSUDRAFT_35401 [Hypholoma sublateritium FD-334 SS-4]|uniref:Transcription factor TFIIB cyclin-like domain-containing protein n=1 Tax=Hypholoma sublateritium (strain FD-334 SS-4) TaxID=945553 RepID=A0A0D2LIM5_HYPSF|nr:hypothetical protein HYPSUDRAFT_35401 [Hypholoma sublateritium FD-334 SS-4]